MSDGPELADLAERRRRKRILFIHGLEGGPTKWKASYLREHYDCVCPDMGSILRREKSPIHNPLLALTGLTAGASATFAA